MLDEWVAGAAGIDEEVTALVCPGMDDARALDVDKDEIAGVVFKREGLSVGIVEAPGVEEDPVTATENELDELAYAGNEDEETK